MDKNKITVVAQNKKAYHDYFVLETVEAGLELLAVYGEGTKEEPAPDCERVYFIAREQGKRPAGEEGV